MEFPMKLLLIISMFLFSISLFAQPTIDFETVGTDWTWIMFANGSSSDSTDIGIVANPDTSGINTSSMVGKFVVHSDAETYAGVFTDDITPFTLTADNSIITVMVYKDVISNFDLKLENPYQSFAHDVNVSNTVTNQWEKLTFDFRGDIGRTITRLTLIPDFPSTRTAGSTNYIDNIDFGQNILPVFGTVQNITFFSQSLNAERNVQIYLPEGYDRTNTTERYPVVYFLHGAGGNQTDYSFIINILDQLIQQRKIEKVIVVKPDGSVPPYWGSYYTNSDLYGRFEDYIVYDLVNYIDSTYNTINSRNKRSIMGHSMGAYGAMKLALKHPDIFGAVATHSGPLEFHHYTDVVDSILAEYTGPPYHFNPNAGKFSKHAFTFAGAFSPNLKNSPYLVDFPLDSLGNPIDSTINKWFKYNPARLASYVSPDSAPAIYFDCGKQDELTLYSWNTAFRDTLDKLGLKYEFLAYNGNHTNQLYNRFQISLAFLDSVMQATTTAVGDVVLHPTIYNLSQNYPNPFNPTTTIKYSIPKQSLVTLKIYDILGRQITTLVNEEKPAGNYKIKYDASSLASGVYFYRLQAGNFVQTKKMILLR